MCSALSHLHQGIELHTSFVCNKSIDNIQLPFPMYYNTWKYASINVLLVHHLYEIRIVVQQMGQTIQNKETSMNKIVILCPGLCPWNEGQKKVEECCLAIMLSPTFLWQPTTLLSPLSPAWWTCTRSYRRMWKGLRSPNMETWRVGQNRVLIKPSDLPISAYYFCFSKQENIS